MTLVTRPRPIPAGSRPRADDRARVLRHPYTAMKEPAWASRMPRAGASRPAAMRLTGPDLDTRQPHGVTNPQSGEAAGTPQAGPPLERSLNPSTQATINAVPGRAWPRKSRRRRQYPVHAPQSRGLGPRTLQLRHRIPGRLPGLRRGRGARLVAPTAQRLRRDPRIPGDLIDRPGLRRTRAARLRQQPNGLRPELRRASRALRHGPIISHRARGNTEQKTVHIRMILELGRDGVVGCG